MQTWKLRNEERLLDIVDPELIEYPEKEVLRFIKIALFCTQAVSSKRPTMSQVVEMLSRNVHLNEKVLTEPGVYRRHSSRQSDGGSTSHETSSSRAKGKQPVTSNDLDSSYSISEMLPR